MRRTELALVSLLGMAGAFVFYQALRAPRRPPPPPAVDSAQAGPSGDALIVEQVAATQAATAAERAELRRKLDAGRYGTYIDDVIEGQDSMLIRWPDRTREPLRVWVQPVSTVKDWRPDFATTAQDAFVEWSDIGIPVRFTFVADSAQADVPVVWIDRFDSGQRIGLTRVGHDGRHILSGQISVATHGTDGQALVPQLIRACVVHEVGHLLGLPHTEDSTSIMTPSALPTKQSVSQTDRATIRLLYSLPGGSVK